MNTDALISIRDLEILFETNGQSVKAVDKISFDVFPGEVFALVGESGCGKSTTALSFLRLIKKPGRISGGEIQFQGKDLLKLNDQEIRSVRGREIGMIFQNPLDYLNPVYSVGWQLSEGLLSDNVPKEEVRSKVLGVLKDLKISDADHRVKSYPHEISGGMRQRVMIGMMLSRNPKLLIADEPTTALDVTIQAQILDLLLAIRDQRQTSVLIITHDFGIVAEIADRVGVMYAGNIVEIGEVTQIFEQPAHPYTRLLINSLPKKTKTDGKLELIPGSVPNLADPPTGCKFHVRCPEVCSACKTTRPRLVEISPGHFCACHVEEK